MAKSSVKEVFSVSVTGTFDLENMWVETETHGVIELKKFLSAFDAKEFTLSAKHSSDGNNE